MPNAIDQRQTGIVVRDALVLEAGEESDGCVRDVNVLGDRFATSRQIEAARADGAEIEIIDGRDMLLVPGLVNAHTHSPLNVLKGTHDVVDHKEFMWRNQADTAGRTPDEIRISALLGCIEHLLSGTTTVIDHFPEQGFGIDDVRAVVDAYAMAGMRAVVALRVFDQPYDDIGAPAGLDEDGIANPLVPRPLVETMETLSTAMDALDRHSEGRIRVCPAPSNPIRCSDDLLVATAGLARRHAAPLHIHLLETRLQRELAYQRYGTSMVRHLDDLGIMSPALSCAHTIWIDDEDIDLLAERGSVVVHNPASNFKIGAGAAPITKMMRKGLKLALGSDGASTSDTLDMHEAMRLAALLHRPAEPEQRDWPRAQDVLKMATVGGGSACLVEGLGTLAIGAPADFILHDLSRPGWVPLNATLSQLVFAGSGRTVDTVVVAGKPVVRHGRILSFDASQILKEAKDLVRHQRERNAHLYTCIEQFAWSNSA